MVKFFSFLSYRIILLSLSLVIACTTPALADKILWTISPIAFSHGVTITGTFIYDQMTNSLSDQLLSATGTDSSYPIVINPFDFTPANSVATYALAPPPPGIGPPTIKFDADYASPQSGFETHLLEVALPYGTQLPPTGGIIPLYYVVYQTGEYFNPAGDVIAWHPRYFDFVKGGTLSGSVVPLPPSTFLLGSGLLGLLGWRRTKNI